MRALLLAILIVIVAPCWGSDATFFPAFSSGDSVDRWYNQANPRPFGFVSGTAYHLFGGHSSPSGSEVMLGTWKVPSTPIYLPDPTGLNGKYVTTSVGYFRTEWQGAGGCVGSLAGAAKSSWPYEHPSASWIYMAPSAWRFGMTHLYQTDNGNFLGCSKVVTIASAGCFYESLGMLVLFFFGPNSVEYAHWADMAWMCENGAFSGPNLLPYRAAELLGLEYKGAWSATKKNVETIKSRGHGGTPYLKWAHGGTHFTALAPGVQLENGWGFHLDTNRKRVEAGVDPSITGSAYAPYLVNLRVFAPAQIVQTGPWVPSPWMKPGWWLPKKGSQANGNPAPRVTLGAFENSATGGTLHDLPGPLLGQAALSAISIGAKIDKVICPDGVEVPAGQLGDGDRPSLVETTTSEDRYPEDPVPLESYWEFTAPSGTVQPGSYRLMLSGTPNGEYRMAIDQTDCVGQNSPSDFTGNLGADGKAEIAIDFQPGELDPGPRPIEKLEELKRLSTGEKVSFEKPCSLHGPEGFYVQDAERGFGALIRWNGEKPQENGGWSRVTGQLVQAKPELIVEADSVVLTDLPILPPTPVMATNNWGVLPQPFCQLVKAVGTFTGTDGTYRLTNGRGQELRLEGISAEQAEPFLGRRVAATGILRHSGGPPHSLILDDAANVRFVEDISPWPW